MTHATGTTRREVLKKAAVGGAIVWTAPILTSSPAFAATGKCSGSKPCTSFYFVKLSGSGGTCAGEDGGGSCGVHAVQPCTGPAVVPDDGCAVPNRPTGGHDGTDGTITYPPGVVPLYIEGKLGSNCYLLQVTDDGSGNLTLGPPSPTPPTCNQVTFSLTGTPAAGYTFTVNVGDTSNCDASPPSGHGISHLNTAFCI